ncbi:hypothetical protein IC229_11930 [Spirosoma sp. BT702]|uniref:Uncharacterized protein n=1 Tax=Spirosoma profusum TaxID=2771354 RepID=A0A927AQX8_9BACT|nr:hypothetical protein [Spirosoma profusum]MBD2701351.1 hypothetical protein [Spirosoma profusum]
MKTTTFLFVLLLALVGCRKETISQVDDGTLPGQFRMQIDPVRCAMPTTQRITVQVTGADTYQFTYDRFGAGSYKLADIKATKLSATSHDLTLNGQSIGQYNFEEIRDLKGTKTCWVLEVHHAVGTSEGLAFMGVKE